ncbi:hypothetical protein CKA32_002159 [Geitlerinema sp. FC II]|nr:hypothetical protein CKA32_002159 [Geitlerinema sp. FC II]
MGFVLFVCLPDCRVNKLPKKVAIATFQNLRFLLKSDLFALT